MVRYRFEDVREELRAESDRSRYPRTRQIRQNLRFLKDTMSNDSYDFSGEEALLFLLRDLKEHTPPKKSGTYPLKKVEKIFDIFNEVPELEKKYKDVAANRMYNFVNNYVEGGWSSKDFSPSSKFPKRELLKMLNYSEKVLKPETSQKPSGLENTLVILSFGSLLASFFFVSNNLTGNAILSSVNSETSMFAGIAFFILGLAGFLYLRKK